MRAPRPIAYLLVFALGAGVSGLAACGGQSSKALIPAGAAGTLKDDLDAVAAAVDAGDCPEASQALARAQNDLDQLPARVSVRLRNRLQQGIDRLRRQVPTECEANATTETQPTATTETTTTPTTPTTTTPTPTTPTTPTPTTPTTTTPPPTDTTGGDSGGVTVP